MGVLDTYNNSNFGRTGGFGGGGSSGGGGGGTGGNSGSGRFAVYDYSARYGDKFWEVSRDDLNGKIVASDNNNSNVGSVNQQLARDWIENDRKRRLAEEQNPGTPDDSEDEEEIPDTSTDTTDTNTQSVGLTDDQRFMLIGLVVLGGILGFIKK